jgi:hypothetical protein
VTPLLGLLVAGVSPVLAPAQPDSGLPWRPFSVNGFVGTSAVGGGFGRDIGFGGGLALKITQQYQVRAELDSFSWWLPGQIQGEGTTLYFIEDLRNTMVFAGLRRYFGRSKFRFYVELGLGHHWLEFERSFGDGLSRPETETKFGGVPGVGIEVDNDGHVCIGFSVRYRAIGSGVGARDDISTRSWRVGATASFR